MINLTPIITAVIGLLTAIITAFLVPYIKANIEAKNLESLLKIAKIAVEAAEQIFKESGMGAKKKEYVEKYLAEHGYTLDSDELDVVIESAVKEMHSMLKD